LTDAESATVHIATGEQPSTRVVSICSRSSLRPLGLPKDFLHRWMDHSHIHPELYDLVLSFGWKPKNCDAGAGGMSIKRSASGIVPDTQYLITFPEAVQSLTTPWTMRQVGVYHQYIPHDEQDSRSLWVFFHAKPNSQIQDNLECSIKGHNSVLQIHVLVLSMHLKSWRWYLDSLNTDFEKIVDIAVTIDFTEQNAYQTGSELLQKLQHFEDIILPLVPRLRSTLTTVATLCRLKCLIPDSQLGSYEDQAIYMDETDSFRTQIQGYIDSTELMKKRSQRILDILTAGLNLQNQKKGLGFSNVMVSLAKDTVEDSATVRVVTIVTLIYLPASFVSSLLGTNLFVFQTTDGSGFQASEQFWIFVVISVPLTMLTVGSWFFYTKRRATMSRRKVQNVSQDDLERA
ncbi:hypothetical protein K505DRAFT_237308, partial [Melanomma pulvis-pyrius CBS 109.77]